MPKISKKLTMVIIGIACVAIVFGIRFFISSSRAGIRSDASVRVKGKEDADIKITEFVDFQCPACAEGAIYLKNLMKDRPEAIRLELKHHPLQMHQHAFMSARYAECAAKQGKFWPFHDYLFERQVNWKRLNNPQLAFEVIAQDVNLNLKDLKVCLEDGKIDDLIQKNKAEGQALGVRSTPTYYVNGKMVVGVKSLQLRLNELLGDEKN